MIRKLKDRLRPSKPEAIDISRLVKPMLSNYAREHRGSFMLVDEVDSGRGQAGESCEVHCIFSKQDAAAAAEYAKKLVKGFGVRCRVFVKTHPELLNHLSPRASFSHERRSRDRKIA